MRLLGVVLALIALSLLLTAALAAPDARVVQVSGSLRVVHPGETTAVDAGAQASIPDGSLLIAAVGSQAQIELPGLGILNMTGPATARLTMIDGVPAIVLRSGSAVFEFASGEVILQVQHGQLALGGVAGYSGNLVGGTEVRVTGSASSARVSSRRGSTLLSSGGDHVRVVSGTAALLGETQPSVGGSDDQKPPQPVVRGQTKPTEGVTLNSADTTLMLPSEVVKSIGTAAPPLKDIQDTWVQGRQSPRVP